MVSSLDAVANWEEVHHSAQVVLAQLGEEMQQRWPLIRSRGGKTLTHLLLFTYRTFEVPSDPSLDSVVVGVDFARAAAPSNIVVRGEMIGDETGQEWLELRPQEVPLTQEALRTAAESMAGQLREQGERLAVALKQPSQRGG